MEKLENKVVLIGGSFNPPTIAHEEMIKEIIKYNPSKILILPNGDKYDVSFVNKKLIKYVDRENMCKLMMKDMNVFYEILDLENRQAFRGSYYTLQELNHPTFIMGSDCLESLHKWIRYEDLVKENNFVVFSRDLSVTDMIKFILEDEFLKNYLDHFDFIKLNKSEVSSSLFRKTKDKKLVNEFVYDYIVSHNLYEVNDGK